MDGVFPRTKSIFFEYSNQQTKQMNYQRRNERSTSTKQEERTTTNTKWMAGVFPRTRSTSFWIPMYIQSNKITNFDECRKMSHSKRNKSLPTDCKVTKRKFFSTTILTIDNDDYDVDVTQIHSVATRMCRFFLANNLWNDPSLQCHSHDPVCHWYLDP